MCKARDVSYEMVGDAICHILELAHTCWLGKVDIKTAFRIMPVRPVHYKLLGAQIQGRFHLDTVLPMGCGSNCRIFEQFSKALVWILNNEFGNKG